MLKVDMNPKAGGGASIVAQGNIQENTADIAHIINAVHTQFNQSEPVLAEAYALYPRSNPQGLCSGCSACYEARV